MDRLSVYFNYDKKAKIATCKLCDVTPSTFSSTEHSFLVEYDLNKISLKSAFKDFCERLDFYKHLLKTPKNCTYGQD